MKFFKKGKMDWLRIALLLAGIYFFSKIIMSRNEGFFTWPGNKISAITTTQNIGRFRGKPSLVLFKANWCGACKKFWQIWKKLGSNINGIPLVTLDSEAHAEIMNLHDIRGYPTIVYLPNGPFSAKDAHVYDGPHSVSNIHNWVENL